MPAPFLPPTICARFQSAVCSFRFLFWRLFYRPFAHLSLLCLVVGFFGDLSGTRISFGQEEPPRATVNIVDETRWLDTMKYVPKPFTAKATVTFQDVSLPEIGIWLQEQVGYPVLIDQFSFQEAGTPSDDVISDELLDEPIYLLLDRLRYAGVHWQFENDVVQLYAGEEERTLGNRQYVVSDLLDQGYTQASLIAAIREAVVCSWDVEGGTCSVNLLGDVLFARLPAESLRYLESLLEALRDPCRRTLVNEPAQNIRLRETLDKKFSVEWRDKPLVLALEEFSKQMGEPIRIDRAALKQRKFSERTLVSLTATEQKASLILERLLKRHGLTWVLRDGVIRVGNMAADEEAPFQLTAVYDVRDLAQNVKESHGLAEAIVEQIQGEWSQIGGQDIANFPIPGILIVRAVERTQDQLLELLGNYRIALKNSKVRVSADTDPNAKITCFYRMPSNVASELIGLLPQLVAPESWKSESQPNGVGTIRLVRSWDEQTKLEQQVVSVSYSVLIIEHRRAIHEEIAKLINKVRVGDTFFQPMVQGGMGGGGMGGGKFGGGMF